MTFRFMVEFEVPVPGDVKTTDAIRADIGGRLFRAGLGLPNVGDISVDPILDEKVPALATLDDAEVPKVCPRCGADWEARDYNFDGCYLCHQVHKVGSVVSGKLSPVCHSCGHDAHADRVCGFRPDPNLVACLCTAMDNWPDCEVKIEPEICVLVAHTDLAFSCLDTTTSCA